MESQYSVTLNIVEAALSEHGVLLVQDRDFPSVTTIVTGAPVSGSWWAHPDCHLIYDVLQALEDRVLHVKLLGGKVTLVDRNLWSVIAGIGAARDEWQVDRLPAEAAELLAAIDGADGLLRIDQLALSTGKPTNAVRTLEKRILVHSDELHTESGRHTKVVQTWERWATMAQEKMANAAAGRAALSAHLSSFADPDLVARLLPWPTSTG